MAVGFDRLGKILVGAKMITEQQLNEALAAQKQKGGGKLGSNLVKMGLIDMVKKHMVLPLKRVGATLTIAMADPTNMLALDDLKFRTNYTVEPAIASESALIDAIKKYYGGGAAASGEDKNAKNAILQAKDYT